MKRTSRLLTNVILISVVSFLSTASISCPVAAQVVAEKKIAETDKAQDSPEAGSDDKQDKERLEDQMKRFLRVKRGANNKPISMQTSVTRYIKTLENGEKLYVDLIGVVHIGEQEYFEKFNELFTGYDAMLYELVAPEGTRIPKGGREEGGGMNPLAAVQNLMKDSLGLEFQLDHVDYTKNNLVHADMSPEEFTDSMEKNDESFMGMFFKAVGQSLAMQGRSKTSDADLLMAMMSNDRTMSLRKIAAEQMQDMESGMVIFQGKDGSTIINHRNKKAFKVLDREVEKGHRKIGVFYGAGHLPDMEDLLENERGMQRAGQYWLDAWKLKRD